LCVAQPFNFIRDVDAAVRNDPLEHPYAFFDPPGACGILRSAFSDRLAFDLQLALAVREPGLDKVAADHGDQANADR